MSTRNRAFFSAFVAAASLAATSAFAAKPAAVPPPDDAAKGETICQAKGSGCHSVFSGLAMNASRCAALAKRQFAPSYSAVNLSVPVAGAVPSLIDW